MSMRKYWSVYGQGEAMSTVQPDLLFYILPSVRAPLADASTHSFHVVAALYFCGGSEHISAAILPLN